jgi:hypothetical protein
MIAWLKLFEAIAGFQWSPRPTAEDADDCRNLHLGIRCAALLEFDRFRRQIRVPIASAQLQLS